MADTDGQLWAEIGLEDKVTPQLKEIIKEFQLVDNSVRKTRKALEDFSGIKLTDSISDTEKNWRSMRGAVADFKNEIDKLRIKMREMDDLGLGNTAAYRRYEEQLKQLLSLRRQLTKKERRGETIGSEDVTRFKQELTLVKKEIANTDIQSKRLVATQKENVSAVEQMVAQYKKMSTSLSSVRQSAIDSGITKFGTQFAQNTVERIQTEMARLEKMLSSPKRITGNMVEKAQAEFEKLESMATRHSEKIRATMSARLIANKSETALSGMEGYLERIKNKLVDLRDKEGIKVDTSQLEKAKMELEAFIAKYREALSSGNMDKHNMTHMAEQYKLLTAEVDKAIQKINGFVAAEKNSRSLRGITTDVQNEIDKLRQKMGSMSQLGLGDTAEYNRYREILTGLIKLKYELLNAKGNGEIIGSSFVERTTSQMQQARKDITGADTASKELMRSQQKNIEEANQLVASYDKLIATLQKAKAEGMNKGLLGNSKEAREADMWLNMLERERNSLNRLASNPQNITQDFLASWSQTLRISASIANDSMKEINTEVVAQKFRTNMNGAIQDIETQLARLDAKIKDQKALGIDTSELEKLKTRLDTLKNDMSTALKGKVFETDPGQIKQYEDSYRLITKELAAANERQNALVVSQKDSISTIRTVDAEYRRLEETLKRMLSTATKKDLSPTTQADIKAALDSIQTMRGMSSDRLSAPKGYDLVAWIEHLKSQLPSATAGVQQLQEAVDRLIAAQARQKQDERMQAQSMSEADRLVAKYEALIRLLETAQRSGMNRGLLAGSDEIQYAGMQIQELVAARDALKQSMGDPKNVTQDFLTSQKAQFDKFRNDANEAIKGIDAEVTAKKFRNDLAGAIQDVEKEMSRLSNMATAQDAIGVDTSKLVDLYGRLNELQVRMKDARDNNLFKTDPGALKQMEAEFRLITKEIGAAEAEQRGLVAAQKDSISTIKGLDAQYKQIESSLERMKSTAVKRNMGSEIVDDLQRALDFVRHFRDETQKAMANLKTTDLTDWIQKLQNALPSASASMKALRDEMDKFFAEQEKAKKIDAARRANDAAEALKKAQFAFDPILSKMQQLNKATTQMGTIWNQFKTQIAFTAFSVYGLEHFLKSIITVGGEFERQRVALQNMLGDMREATELFGQLKNLALESPFTFRQLSTYTKQLAAFSIPYEELFETNKRLSDMSAGLGVDMSRLILAYGQVRAATVLRGQELRQFTEAGVPMVEKLADYFTKLNGELVTTRDIFTMISKKQVPFEAVRAVMKEMTDEGGMFYDMQAKIADTLSGRWGNLKDAWEIMLGSLADSESLMGNSLKWLVELLTSVIRHLTTVSGLIGGLAIGKLFTNFGRLGAGLFGSTRNLDRDYLKSKQLYAVELQRAAMTRKLEPMERNILNTKNRIVEADRLAMLRAGQLSKYQAAMLVQSSQINKNQMMRLALEAGISKEEIRQIAHLSMQNRAILGMKNALNRFSGWDWKAIGIDVGIMAIIGAVGYAIQKYRELKEAQKNAMEELSSTNKDVYEFLSANPLKDKLSVEEAMRAIEKYDEELKKVAPNYLEIKARIVGEHGESPQQQAQDYKRALYDAMNGASMASTKGTSDWIIEAFDWVGPTNANDIFNSLAKNTKEINQAINALSPNAIEHVMEKMDGLDENTKNTARDLVMTGEKLDALRLISSKTGKSIDQISASFWLGIPKINTRTDTNSYEEEIEDWVESVAEGIRNEWSEYFTNGKFDESKKMSGAAKSGILQTLRDAASTMDMSPEASGIFYMMIENALFGYSDTAMNKLAEQYTQVYAGDKDAIVEAIKNGNMPEDIKAQLQELANKIGETDTEFKDQIKDIFKNPTKLISYILLHFNIEADNTQEWQKEMIKDFGDAFEMTIKAAPDIPSALDAITKLRKEAGEKIKSMKPLMISLGFQVDGLTPIDKDKIGYYVLAPAVQQAIDQYNDFVSIISGFAKNKQEYGLTDPKLKGEKSSKSKGKNEDKELQSWQRHVELYKKFLDQYRELTKMWGEKKALDTLRDSKAYEWVVDFARGRGLDITDIDAMNDALNSILDVNKGDKQKRKDAMAKRYADIEAEGYKRQGDALKRLNDQLNEQLKILNEQYDAYQKIFTITGNKEGAMQLAFGGNVTSERYIDELTEQLRDALRAVNWSETIDDALEMTKEKVNEVFGEESEAANLINKTKEERNKLEKEYIDILANALTSDMSLEDKRAEAVRKYNEELRKLIELRGKATTEEAKAQAQAGIDALTRTNNRTVAGYDQQIFERDANLGGLMNHLNTLSRGYLRAILVQLRDSMSMYANDKTPEGMAAREKLADQIMKVTDALKDLNDTVTDIDDDFYTGGDGKRYITGVTATRYGFKQDQEIDENTETIVRNAEEFRQLTKKINQINTLVKDLENVLKPVIDLFEAIGYEGNSLSKALELASNALSAASNTTSSLSSLSQGAAAAGNTGLAKGLAKAGPYAAAAAVGLSVVSQMFKWQQQAIQDDIDASKRRQQEMEALSSNLERVLERTLGGIYSMRASDAQNSKFSDILKTFKVYNEGGNDALAKMLGVKGNFWNLWTYSQHDIEPALEKIRTYTKETRDAMQEALNSDSYYDANYASLLAQRDEMQRQLDLENDKKKRDLSAISDLEQNIIEIQDKIQYYALDIAKAIYNIDVKSWADSLAETIVDAWAKGEDAVDAYKKKVKEIMRDVVTNIISQKIIQEALKRANVEGIITSEMEAKNGMLDEFSVRAIGDALVSATDQAVGNATKLLDYLKSVGWDLSDTADNASTLGKGIASITEDTADLLASYINAIRADVAAMRALEERILEGGFADVNSNLALQLTELRNISAFAERNAVAAERILELFDSVTTVGSNGRKVKI